MTKMYFHAEASQDSLCLERTSSDIFFKPQTIKSREKLESFIIEYKYIQILLIILTLTKVQCLISARFERLQKYSLVPKITATIKYYL